jgi:predicted RNA-binding Zn-ribbon protein involved in translation (DUF1610 family)
MSEESQRCPKCSSEKIWRYGSRRKGHSVLRKFLCPACGHIWEAETSEVWSVKPDLVDLIVKLMEKAVGDAERGTAANERGWMEFDKKTAEELLGTNLCERDESGSRIRILPQAQLPEDLAGFGVANTFLSIRTAEKVELELEEMWKDQRRYEAVLQGLKRMLESGVRTISPELLGGEKIYSWDWFTLAHNAVNSLVLTAAEMMWDNKVDMARELLGERVRGAEVVENVLHWKDVLARLGRDAVEALGFLWFADVRLQQAEDPVAKRAILKTLLESVGEKSLRKIKETLEEMEVSYVNFPWW